MNYIFIQLKKKIQHLELNKDQFQEKNKSCKSIFLFLFFFEIQPIEQIVLSREHSLQYQKIIGLFSCMNAK
jgi:hypothetical protein